MKPASIVRSTLLYLAAPHFLFLSTWFNPVVGLLSSCVLVGGLVMAWRAVSGADAADAPRTPGRVIVVACILALLMTLISGAGGIFHQTWDWEKHNAVLLDLARYQWPVVYELPGPERYHLVYYLGYYMPTAVAAKLWGASAGQVILFAWTAIGTLLSLLWFVHLVRLKPVLTLVVFPLLSGMDLLGYGILHGGLPSWFQNVEGWLRGYVYFANLVLHVWSPQHALSVWLGTPLVLYCMSRPRLIGTAVFGWSLLLFWSSFAFIAIAVVLSWAVFAHRQTRELPKLIRAPEFVGTVAAALALVGVEWVFLSNSMSRIPFSWLWENVSLREFAPRLLLFYLVEFGFYLLLLPNKKALAACDRSLLFFSAGLLLVAPWMHFGLFNDLMVRLAHVGMYIFWVALLTGLWKSTPEHGLRRAVPLFVCLGVGAITPFLQVQFILRATAINPHPARANTPVPYLQPIAIAAQYLGRLDSWKAKILNTDGNSAAILPPLAGSAPFAFASPLLLFNFRGQGVHSDSSGWWMWNREILEFAYRVQDQTIVQRQRPVRITFLIVAADRDRTVTVQLRGTKTPIEKSMPARLGAWSEIELGPVTLAKPELTLFFSTLEPITGDKNDPHRREFAVKNVRFDLLDAASK